MLKQGVMDFLLMGQRLDRDGISGNLSMKEKTTVR